MRPDGVSRRDALLLTGSVFAAGLEPGVAAGSAATKPAAFRRGVNTFPWFSLTREFHAPRTDYAWPPFQEERAVPRPEDLRRLADAGFDFVRIPVDPGPFLDARDGHRKRLMASLFDAVRAAQGAGLGVVVNIQANDATHYYRSANLIAAIDAPLFAAYRSFVVACAEGLAPMGPRIALEPVNEPPKACGSETWLAVQSNLFAAVRARAPALTLVATGSCGSMVSGLTALDPKPLAAFAPLLFTFHFYEPYLFSHQGAPWMQEPVYRALNAVPWPGSAGSLEQTLSAVKSRMELDAGRSPAEKREALAITERLMRQYFEANPGVGFLALYFDQVSAWVRAHAIPRDQVLMGEFGAVKTWGTIVGASPADRVRYVRDVREAAEARGFGWAFWNLFDSMGLMDDTSRAFDADIIRALGLRSSP
ncbi:glycoside hydrolase family 5 protein [Beijerinckia sp. L45]|uniref:glycoside hydrolase family 5 protein n=1 Tax=Beijerinckia sp. L45 TaxID=1641855 RepID=UPI00131BAD7B|nr:cellulase family glycosylhydrolase [Beijerinckia sp. L45]